jgi:DMSO/TMAO reductase YedYZ molybdopterin-dependent catalytic subunit
MLVNVPRREVITTGTAALAAMTFLQSSRIARAFPSRPGEAVIPWLDQPEPNPDPVGIQNQLVWEELDSWVTPNDAFFSISHFDRPTLDAASWGLDVGGLVERPMRLGLEDIRSRPRQEVVFTVECAGNHGFPFFTGGIGNARWVGTPLRALLEEAGPKDDAIEVVFWGADVGTIERKDDIRNVTMQQHFARAMSLEEAMAPENILAYEMNGAELPQPNGYPLRLIAPGWYGIANVKWLTGIELRDRRFMSQMMGRDYVTIREEVRNGETVWAETSVGKTRLKSAPARITESDGRYRIVGAAWGAPIAAVEVQIDDGPWQPATIDQGNRAPYAWDIWSFDWPNPSPGEHSITSRATDEDGNVQPAPDDPWVANKHTYWESNGQITRRVAIG